MKNALSTFHTVVNYFIIASFLVAISACDNNKKADASGENEVRQAMVAQMSSWNEGDIREFMTYYWKSDSLQFVSKNGITKGWNHVLTNYQKAYDSREKMGTLKFDLKQVNQISDDCVFVVGTWDLAYTNKPSSGGYFTLLWKLKPEGWRIVIDHTS